MTRLVLELEDDFHLKIKTQALKEGKTMREIMTALLEKWLNAKKSS